MSRHHPDDITLLNYSAGSLSEPQALAISTHLSFCHECCANIKSLNRLGGALLDNITPATVDDREFDNFFDALKTRLACEQAPAAPEKNAQRGYKNPLLGYLNAQLKDLAWQRQTSSISKYDLNNIMNVGGFKVALQKISAGAKVPTHTHRGQEYTVILSGGFSDELGVYHQGDFIARDASHKHSPTALQNEDCISLTVLDAP